MNLMSTTTSYARVWHQRLGELPDPPSEQLYTRGDRIGEALTAPAVAIVGARACSSYGAHIARNFAHDLAAAGVTIVSGLARGIDAEAHRGALDAGGLTLAVLGCGIDHDYPAAHAELAKRVAANGGLLSEYQPGVEPAPWRFPARNRLIAALAQAVVVVEARERSGALITVDLAMEIRRPIYAVPGEITSVLSAGTNELLRRGWATALTTADDVLDALRIERNPDAG
jgi:DNA processing protein